MGTADFHVVEPVPIADVFISGIAKVERLGPCARFTYYVDQEPIGGHGPVEHVVVARIVIALSAIPAAAQQVVNLLDVPAITEAVAPLMMVQ